MPTTFCCACSTETEEYDSLRSTEGFGGATGAAVEAKETAILSSAGGGSTTAAQRRRAATADLESDVPPASITSGDESDTKNTFLHHKTKASATGAAGARAKKTFAEGNASTEEEEEEGEESDSAPYDDEGKPLPSRRERATGGPSTLRAVCRVATSNHRGIAILTDVMLFLAMVIYLFIHCLF